MQGGAGGTMAKGKGDFILRDRLQLTLDSAGDSDTVYGRMDLSDFVNAIEKQALAVKEIYLQVRDPNNESGASSKTGIWNPFSGLAVAATPGTSSIEYKLCATTRAYESLRDVGIGSPDVLYVEEHLYTINRDSGATGEIATAIHESREWPTRDLHPEGYVLVSDLLIGLAVDDHSTEATTWDDALIEIDIMMVVESVSVTQKMLTNLLTQAQDV